MNVSISDRQEFAAGPGTARGAITGLPIEELPFVLRRQEWPSTWRTGYTATPWFGCKPCTKAFMSGAQADVIPVSTDKLECLLTLRIGTRVVPIGTSRLLAVLEWLRLDSTGGRKGDEVPVFSNEAGEPLKTFKKAWQVAVLKAHGVARPEA